MARVQLALNVPDLDAAIEFYSLLLATPPAKVRPGYANFAVDDPPLKLVLIEHDRAHGVLNHLGIEVSGTEQVQAAGGRLAELGLDTRTEDGVTCCYALQDKVWVDDPAGAPWEIYTVVDDASPETDWACPPDGSASICCTVSAGAPSGETASAAPTCCP
jgi:catechol 2,3-dioxygenase-like lactoylglutathione lyase family enzyme